jgi:2-polyprenyl-6-methoxyphenol hydroxylase-like FAD-dependent oxidoreductase
MVGFRDKAKFYVQATSTMASMTTTYDVCIRGNGIVGSTLALLLARQRLRIALVGTPTQAIDMRAFALNSSSQGLLTDLRCWPSAEFATPVTGMEIWGDQAGKLSFDAPFGEYLNHIVDVQALESLLQEAVGFQHSIERVENNVSAPLTIVCEGKNSLTRNELGIDFQALPYFQHALATRVRCASPHNQRALQWFSQDAAGLSVLALLPLGGPHSNEAAVVWSMPSERALSQHEVTDEALSLALSNASQYALGNLQVISAKGIWPLQAAKATQWSGTFENGNRWVLAGDAAHTVHPLAGMGLNLGLADAASLAKVLSLREGKEYWRSVGDTFLLRRYVRERKSGLLPTWLACDGLQRLFSHPHTLAQSMRNWGMSQFDQLSHLKQWTIHQAMHPSI